MRHHLLGSDMPGAYLAICSLAHLFQRDVSIVDILFTAGLTGYFGAAYTGKHYGRIDHAYTAYCRAFFASAS